MSDHLLITARLLSPLAGDAPQLDGLMEYLLSLHHRKGDPGYKVDRSRPAPPQAAIPIPLPRRSLRQHAGIGRVDPGPDARHPPAYATWQVGRCSGPIYPISAEEYVEHVNKRIAVEEAAMLAPASRLVVSTTNSWTKSYRLPLRVRRIDRVCWFAVGDRRRLLGVLRRCPALGKKVSVGYGRVAEWTAEHTSGDYSWFAPSAAGPVLMRALPVGDWLPAGLIGARRDFGAACPPYWHPERYTEIVRPS